MEFWSNESRLNATTNQILNKYLPKSKICDTAANDWFKSSIVTIGKCD